MAKKKMTGWDDSDLMPDYTTDKPDATKSGETGEGGPIGPKRKGKELKKTIQKEGKRGYNEGSWKEAEQDQFRQ